MADALRDIHVLVGGDRYECEDCGKLAEIRIKDKCFYCGSTKLQIVKKKEDDTLCRQFLAMLEELTDTGQKQ